MVDHPLDGVLDGDDAVENPVALDLLKDLMDAVKRKVARRKAKLHETGQVGESGAGPQVGHRQGLFQREGGRYNLPEYSPQGVVGKGPLVDPLQPLVYRSLPFGDVIGGLEARLLLPDVNGQLRPLIQKL